MGDVFRTQVRMPVELSQKIRDIADKRFTSMNSIIVEALNEYVANKKADCTRQSNQSASV